MTMHDGPLFLGIDGGGTKTASVIIDSQGRRVAEGMGGPSNSFHNPIEIVVQSVQDSVQSALAQVEGPVIRAGCVAPRFEGIVDYLSNALSAAEFDWIGERRAGFAAAGIEREMGVVIIAGTGSSFHAVRADGTSKSAGGWGSLLGDEGSAFDIAVQAIKKGLRAIDGRGPATALSGRLQSFFAQNDDHAFVHATTIARLPRNHIARFAAEAVQAAREGDEAAMRIYEDAARSLGSDAAFVARALFDPGDEFPVVLAGGVFEAGDLIVPVLAETVHAEFPRADVMRTQVSPAEGAARIALWRFEGRDGV
jgi:N-acetylglucosamine kinase-like BadF-type ATPase